MAICLLQAIIKVAVIGAGISGIGSSYSLTKNNMEHIIIEGRNRVGGRIVSKKFDGIQIQLGAAIIHKTGIDNRIAQIVREQGWNYKVVNTDLSYFSYQGQGHLNSDTIGQGIGIFGELCKKVVEKQKGTKKFLNLKEAAGNYFQQLTNHTQETKATGKWFYDLFGNYNGAKMTDLGTVQCQQGTLDEADFEPTKGYSALLQHIYKGLKPKEVYFNQVVKKIDYSGRFVKIYTQNKAYFAEKVISSLPLGVLQQQSVEFIPKLPQSQTKALFDLGNGIFNKIFVSFQQPFWDVDTHWVDFITKNEDNKYPASLSIVSQGRYILCFFVSDEDSKKISKFTNQQLHDDLLSFLKRFYPRKNIKIRAIQVTSWHEDPFSLGSYSYRRVGKDTEKAIRTICTPVDNKIWFVGEHCHPTLYTYAHGAFETGIWAAENVTALLK